jgi:hypothetical protein
VEFDDAIDRFGAAVVGPAGGEVGQELFPPGSQGSAESGDLRDWAGRERFENSERDRPAVGEVRGVKG